MFGGRVRLTTRLTVVATIFLPLTFLTGFCGMLAAVLIAFLYVRRNETREQLRG
jgi:hypothetical protein